MEPLTITIGLVAGAVANALAGPKRRYKGEVGTLPGESAVPGELGQDYRFATRISPYSSASQSYRFGTQISPYSSASQRQVPRLRSRTPTYTAPHRDFQVPDRPTSASYSTTTTPLATPRAQAAPGTTTTPPAVPFSVPGMQLKGVRVMVSRGPNMPAGDVIYDGKMSPAQMENLRRSIQQNATTAPDHRLISVTITGPGVAMSIWPTQKITSAFATNLRRLLSAVAA